MRSASSDGWVVVWTQPGSDTARCGRKKNIEKHTKIPTKTSLINMGYFFFRCCGLNMVESMWMFHECSQNSINLVRFAAVAPPGVAFLKAWLKPQADSWTRKDESEEVTKMGCCGLILWYFVAWFYGLLDCGLRWLRWHNILQDLWSAESLQRMEQSWAMKLLKLLVLGPPTVASPPEQCRVRREGVISNPMMLKHIDPYPCLSWQSEIHQLYLVGGFKPSEKY